MCRKFLISVLLMSCIGITYAQKIVTGRVMEKDSTGIPGVNVVEKWTTNGTITDTNGYYRLSVKEGAILVFSFIGFKQYELQTGNQTSVDLIFRPDILATAKPPEIPEFDFPPPRPSARCVMEKDFFRGCGHLNKVDTILSKALYETGYYEKSYFSVPNGFALVTRIEKINEDGTSKEPPERWEVSVNSNRFKIESFVKALFLENKGYFRVIAFIITDKSFSASTKEINKEDAMAWLNKGNLTLPDIIGSKEFTKKYQVIALIYEFEKTESSSTAFLSDPSNLNGITHLDKSKILAWLQLNQ
jgi:hypothetical protein